MAIQNSALAAAAKQYRMDKAYNPEEGTLTYGGYNAMPKTGGTSGAPSPTGGNAMTGGGNTMTGNSNAMTVNGNAMTGVRNAMVGAGLDNSKIGFNNGKVTYNGADFLTPDNVTDGVSYASSDAINRALGDYYKNQGMLGVRETLNSRGVDNGRIGWNAQTGMVTIDGKDAFKPSTNVDGTTYAASRDINNLTDVAYRNAGNPVLGADAFAAANGLQNAVTWSDGKLMVGGNPVDVMYVDDNGTAYAKESDLKAALDTYRKNSGIIGNSEVYNNWNDKYGDKINAALDAILNREAWDYNPETDPAYQAYRDAYTREGNRAYQDAYAQMAAATGGYGSSAGMTAAGQQLNYYMQQLGDRIPELEQNSYNRWYNDQQLNRAALESLIAAADSDYNKAYQANRDAINDTNNANYYSYLRSKDARDFNRSALENDREWAYREAAYQLQNDLTRDELTRSNVDTANYPRMSELNIQLAENELYQSNLERVLGKYSYNGDRNRQISAEDAALLGISPKADGTYPTIGEIYDEYAYLQYRQSMIQQGLM